MVVIVQLSALSSRRCKSEPKDKNVTLVNRIREKLPLLSEHVHNFVFTNSAVPLVIDVFYLCGPFEKECWSQCRAASLGPTPSPSAQQTQSALPVGLQSPATLKTPPFENKTNKQTKNNSRRMERYRIYDWSTHLFEPSFTPTFAYKTSTIAGSSFIYSIPFTSSCRGFPSVTSLLGDNRKVQGQFYHIVTTWSSLILMLFFFFKMCCYIKNALSLHVLLQTSTAEAGAHVAEKKWGMFGVLKECEFSREE